MNTNGNSRTVQRQFWRVAAEGGHAALVTVVRGQLRGAKLLVTPDQRPDGSLCTAALTEAAIAAAEDCMWRGESELVALDGETAVFVHVTAPPA